MPHSWLPFVGQIFVNCYILNFHFIVVQRYYNTFLNFGFIQAYRRVFPTFGFGLGGAPIPFWLLHIGHRLPPAFSISTEIRTKHEYKYKKGTTNLNYFPVSKNFKCEVSSFLINRSIFLPCCNVKDCVRPHSDSTTAGLTKASLFIAQKNFQKYFFILKVELSGSCRWSNWWNVLWLSGDMNFPLIFAHICYFAYFPLHFSNICY